MGYNVQIGWDNEHTLNDIMTAVKEANSKIDSFAYGEFADERKLPFSIPSHYINENVQFPKGQPGLASCIDQFIKKDHEVENFEEYIRKFLHIYTNRPGREYVKDFQSEVPLLLAKQVLKKFPNTSIA